MVAIRTGTEACPYGLITPPTGRIVGFSNSRLGDGFPEEEREHTHPAQAETHRRNNEQMNGPR